MVRRFKHDHATLDIIVEFAKEKEIEKENKPPSEDNEFSSLFVKPAMIKHDDENPLRNVLQMDQRFVFFTYSMKWMSCIFVTIIDFKRIVYLLIHF